MPVSDDAVLLYERNKILQYVSDRRRRMCVIELSRFHNQQPHLDLDTLHSRMNRVFFYFETKETTVDLALSLLFIAFTGGSFYSNPQIDHGNPHTERQTRSIGAQIT